MKYDLKDKKFGRLTAIEFLGLNRSIWRCKCDCGAIVEARAPKLMEGVTTSCGCGGKKHGLSKRGQKSKTYGVWCAMKSRCNNPNSTFYSEYGGRGIKVCQQWSDSYPAFLSDMGEQPQDMTIDRIDNNKGYEPENCRWATRKEQARNRRSNHSVEFNGQIKTITEWAEGMGTTFEVIEHRLNGLKWSIERSLTEPVRPVVKFTLEEVVEIRRRLAIGHKPIDLAAEYGVSRGVIYEIKHQRSHRRPGDNMLDGQAL